MEDLVMDVTTIIKGNPSPCRGCGKSNTRKLGVCCSTCSDFFHMSCAKLTKAAANCLAFWSCRSCLFSRRRQAPVPPIQLQSSSDNVLLQISKLRMSKKIPLRIPKQARISAAFCLSKLITEALTSGTDESWIRAICFAPLVLGHSTVVPLRSQSFTSAIKENATAIYNMSMDDLRTEFFPNPGEQISHSRNKEKGREWFRAQVNRKLLDGDARAAVRVLSSDDSVAETTTETLEVLRGKHPCPPTDLRRFSAREDVPALLVTEDEVIKGIRSFGSSSSGGIDGLRPSHIKDMTSGLTLEAETCLVKTITRLVERIVNGEISSFARDLLFGAHLFAFRKNDGGIRPIAVGNYFRRLSCKIAAKRVSPRISAEFSPTQLGVGVSNGCEAAVHGTCAYFSADKTLFPDHVAVKLDITNAFNSVRRDCILEACAQRTPEILRLVNLAYGSESSLVFGDHIVRSRTGVQQGDPLGPLLFALAIDDVVRQVKAPFNLWYLDDATIGGPADLISQEVSRIVTSLSKLGLSVNTKKTEIINISYPDDNFAHVTASLRKLLPDTPTTPLEDVFFLGCPFGESMLRNHLRAKESEISRFNDRLSLLDSHTSFFLLKNNIHVPKLMFALRCSPCYKQTDILQSLDTALRTTTESILNIRFDEPGWSQCKLPLDSGGAGLRSVLDLALPSFLSSLLSCRALSSEILRNSPGSSLDRPFAEARGLWNDVGLKLPSQLSAQRCWDEIACQFISDKLATGLNHHRLACLRAAAVPHSGSWLNALPLSSLGTLLDDDSMRIGVALRLGLDICEEHRCKCGGTVDVKGIHPLSCKRSAGRAPRHSALNNEILRALEAAGFPSLLEPVGLDRGDGKRPDGMTTFPYSRGKSLVWDSTCVDTFTNSKLIASAISPGSAAAFAEAAKIRKYSAIGDRFRFVPVALETSGVAGPITTSFLREIGGKIAYRRKEPRETYWLRQRIGIAVIRGNAHSIKRATASL